MKSYRVHSQIAGSRLSGGTRILSGLTGRTSLQQTGLPRTLNLRIRPHPSLRSTMPTRPWESGLTDLYATERSRLVGLAFTICGSREVAEEVVQDAFIEVDRRASSIEQPLAYLKTVVVHGAIRAAKREARQYRHGTIDRLSVPSSIIEWYDLLMQLPERQRAAIVLRYLEDIDDQRIADVLGCSRSTVRSLIRRALKTLKVRYER